MISGCWSSMEMLEGKDEFHGPEARPFNAEKATTSFPGPEYRTQDLEDRAWNLRT